MKKAVVRILFEYRGSTTKFLSFFAGQDNSFYFHPYRPMGTPWYATPQSPLSESTESGIRGIHLHFPSFQPSPFTLNKLSFHASGYIHLTDLTGSRFRNGTRGPSFSEVNLPYEFAGFVPCDPLGLPVAESLARYHNMIIKLNDNVAPFHLNFMLISSKNRPLAKDGPFFKHPVSFCWPGHDMGIGLTMWPVKPGPSFPNPQWPPFPFHIYRIAA